jgi:hypothetical protein
MSHRAGALTSITAASHGAAQPGRSSAERRLDKPNRQPVEPKASLRMIPFCFIATP